MRKKILQTIGWLQMTLFLASFAPTLYAVFTEGEERLIWPVFYRGFLILAPIVVLGYAVQRCKFLWLYLAAGVASMCGTGWLAWLVGPALTGEKIMWGYVLVVIAETFALMQWYLSGRLQRQNEYAAYLQEHTNVTFLQFFREKKTYRGMSKPYLLLIFPTFYLVGLVFENASLCDLTMLLTAFYAELLVISVYLEKTEEYLSLHKSTKSVPRRRMYGIGRGMLGIFLMLLFVGMLPGIFLAGRRSYTNARNWMDEYDFSGLDEEVEELKSGLLPENKSYSGEFSYNEPPAWLNGILYLVAVAAVGSVIFFIYRTIHGAFVDFRASFDDNGDLVEDLEEEATDGYERIGRRKKRRGQKPNGRDVRSLYRNIIKKHRKDLPMPWETPTEIETNAGLAADEAMQKLHGEYEKVRYGK